MRLFSYLLRFSRKAFLLAIGASVISGGTGAAFVAVVNSALGGSTAGLVWTFVALCLATIVTRFVSQNLLFRLSQGVIFELRRRLVDGILSAPLRSVERIGTPKLYSALSDDVVVIADALPGVPMVCSSVAFTVVCLAYLMIVSPVMAAASLVATALGVVVYRLFSKHGLRFLSTAREQQDRLFEHFRGITDGLKELKLDRRRRTLIAGHDLDVTATEYRKRSVQGLAVYEGAAGSSQAVFFGLIGVLLFAFPLMFGISAKTLTDAVMVLLFLVSSLQGVLTWLPQLGRASVALGKIEERLDSLEHAENEAPEAALSSREPVAPVNFEDWGRIEFRGVSHVYPGPAGEEFVLGPLDFTFERGEILFIVGGNGSGKTTLAKLFTSLYLPEQGSVFVDGVEITAANRDTYRQLFATVFSDFFLFDSLLGLGGEDRAEQARAHLRKLELDHKVSIVDEKFSTTALSQGQRKRLALVTAYLADRSCYLFDEWAADQDPVFKDFFYRELLGELKAKNKAVVVISHDDRYFGVADRVVRLDYGRIRNEEGDREREMAERA